MSYFTGSGNSICEIRWHGRGGQGAISSAQMLAEAAYGRRFQGVTASPSFGAERRGVPVTASTRLSSEPVRIFSQVEYPDVVIVLDETLLVTANALSGLNSGGLIIVNSPKKPEQLELPHDYSIATADASKAAKQAGLVVSGFAMVNTAMLGAFARATEIISIDSLERVLSKRFSSGARELNYKAACLTYEMTQLLRSNSGN